MQNILDVYMEMTGQNKEILLDPVRTTIEIMDDPMRMAKVFMIRTEYEGRRYASSLSVSTEEVVRMPSPETFVIETLKRNLIEAIQDGGK